MPEQGTSPLARVLAVGGLVAVMFAVIAVIAASGGGESGGDSDEVPRDSGPDIVNESDTSSRKIQNALDRGEYIVERGDTLVTISEATGVEIETLEQLNPGLDPQQLQEGERIRLK